MPSGIACGDERPQQDAQGLATALARNARAMVLQQARVQRPASLSRSRHACDNHRSIQGTKSGQTRSIVRFA
jgi:hypothetical protein